MLVRRTTEAIVTPRDPNLHRTPEMSFGRMPQRTLIIGCGYLGRAAARLWIATGRKVWALTRSTAHASELLALGVEPLVGDLLADKPLPQFPKVDSVLYAVARDRGSNLPPSLLQCAGLEKVLNNLPGFSGRLTYISSSSVYGQDDGEWVDESSECRPTTQGGQACLEAEGRAQVLLPSVNVLRLAGLYGPGRLLARIAALRQGVAISGRPDAWLNLVHLNDAAAAVAAADTHLAPGTTRIICDDRPSRRFQYFELLSRLINAPAPRFQVSTIEANCGLNKRLSNRAARCGLLPRLDFPTIDTGLPAAVGLA
jgi:nucleoside-diphosphate-sugar epimerase